MIHLRKRACILGATFTLITLCATPAFAQAVTATSTQSTSSISSLVASVSLNSAANPTDANSPEYKAAVEKLQALIVILMKIVAQLIAQHTKAPATPASACGPITRTLTYGAQGNDVKCLQQFLISGGYLSAGSASGYYGPLTVAAVQQYQQTQNIITSGTPDTNGFGAVGPQTQQQVNQSISGGAGAGASGTGNVTSSGATSPASSGGTSGSSTGNVSASGSGCVLDGLSLDDGATGTFFHDRTVPSGQTCQQIARLCTAGSIDGDVTYQYKSCVVQSTSGSSSDASSASCVLDGVTLQDGQSSTFYAASSVAYGVSCATKSLVRTCTAGVLSGNPSYDVSVCVANPPLSCTFDTQTIPSGTSITAYQAASIPNGQSCVSEVRSCSNGTLSGSYEYSGCAVSDTAGAGPTCTLTGYYADFAGSAYLRWTTDGATSASLNHNIGPVNLQSSDYNLPNNEYYVDHAHFTLPASTYTLTATGPDGIVKCTKTVAVSDYGIF